VQAHHIQATTCLEFYPVTHQQLAGLICYYNTYHYHYLHVYGHDDGIRKYLSIITNDKYDVSGPELEPVDVTGVDRLYLKVDYNGAALQFYYAVEADQWQKIGPVLDGSILSDDYVENAHDRYRACFTGAFVGLCCQDLSGRRQPADFDWFEYKEI